MRLSYRYLILCFALILCLQSVAAAPHAAVRRQDDSPSEQSSTPSSTAREDTSGRPSATPTPTPSGVSSSRIQSDRPSSTANLSVKPSESPSASVTEEVPTVAGTDQPEPQTTNDADPENPLPIHPTLTPAMGISGVLLLLSGLAYAIIGIKNKWVHIFGSAGYLSSLAVTVLIVYLMNPPVTDAIQGAFFVAAFFTGVIFGILSLVFSDITEGFGCLLGGFCLSMWFLSLKDDGLITSGTGRAIFIGCMAAGGYSLSFSHYTRNYGLIASIAFSGATAAILGIDCLAGSGWKEFWLYLWNLNDDIFPLNTNTYPLTKNIKAELAGVVIIAVFGIISQMRVWKLVKEHREKSAADQLEKQQDQDREEEERGRKVEDDFQKERAQWEAAYGGKSIPDSSVRSSITSPKGSTYVREKEVSDSDSLEMVNMAKGGVVRAAGHDDGTTVTVSVLKDDTIQQIDAQGNPVTPARSVPASEAGSDKDLPSTPGNEARPVLVKRNSLRPSAPPPPPSVVPLPFTIPKEDDARSEDDVASVSAVPETYHDDAEYKPMSKRVSDVSAMRQRISRDVGTSQEVLIGAQDAEDDRASSVAATLDGDHEVLSIRQLSPPPSPLGTEHNKFIEDSEASKKETDTTEDVISSGDAQAQSPIDETSSPTTKDTATVQASLTASTDPKDEAPRQKRSPVRADTLISSSKSSSADHQSKSTRSGAPSQGSQTEQAESHVGSLRDGALPERLSKVALSYRTNEWAKHLEAADKPDYEDMFLPSSPGATLPDGTEEVPAPISEEIASHLIQNKRSSRRISSGSKPQRNSSFGLQRTPSSFSQDSHIINQRTSTQSPPNGVLSRTNSGTRLDVLAPLPNPTTTLLSKRESLIKNRASSQSLTPHTSAANLLAEQDDMPLSQRRQLLQQQQQQITTPLSPRKPPPSTSQKWAQKSHFTSPAPPNFNSHPPQRRVSTQSSDQKREQLYGAWRQEIRDVTPPAQQSAEYVVEQQRIALLNERRVKEQERLVREKVKAQRASQMEGMMRSGQMLGAHREAMRKMQAKAGGQ